MQTFNRFKSAGVTALIIFFTLLSFQKTIAQDDTLNVKYNTNPLYKYSSLDDISEIKFSDDESEMIFTFTDATTTTETVSSIVEITLDVSILGGGDPLAGLLAAMAVSTGWNMISVPLELDDMTKVTLFPTAVSKAWWYNNGYVEADILEKGKAYWLKFDAPVTSQLRGTRFSGTVPVNSGWNMVGPYNDNIDTASIVYDNPNIKQSNYWGYNNGYFAEDILEANKGYWVKLSTGGTLDINGELAKAARDEPVTNNNDWGRIIISDNSEKEVTLYAC